MKIFFGLSESKEWSHVGNVYVMDFEGEGQAMIPSPLDPRYDLRNHSPSGFAWGYGGSGPAQLALAILAEAAGAILSQKHYQRYKEEVVARMSKDCGWIILESDVVDWLEEQSKSAPIGKNGGGLHVV